MVVSELRGEKIDIIPFNEEPARFVAKALSPARVREVLVDDDAKQATVIVPDDQLSLAIGKEGLNARLAARLTGWRVDIRSETEFAEEESTMGYEEEEVAGRCAAILANGKRCPNAALPGSRYCGLPAHQALEDAGGRPRSPPEEPASTEAAGAADAPAEEVAAGRGDRGRGPRRGATRGRARRGGAAGHRASPSKPERTAPPDDGAEAEEERHRRRARAGRGTDVAPERRCVGCGRALPQDAMLRFVRTADGSARADPERREHGRGRLRVRQARVLRAAARRPRAVAKSQITRDR